MSFVLAEGVYSSYAVYDSFDDSSMYTYIDQCAAFINCLETKATLITQFYETLKVYDIETKTLGTDVILGDNMFENPNALGWRFISTFLNTYMAVIEHSTKNLLIYKNGVLLQTLTPADLGLTAVYVLAISFSPRGKYIFITGTRIASGLKGWVVLKGT